jgi:hypothetical protein
MHESLVADLGPFEVKDSQAGESLQMRQAFVRYRRPCEIQGLKLIEIPHMDQHGDGYVSTPGESDMGDMTEEVGCQLILKPSWPPRLPAWNVVPIPPLPVVEDNAACVPDGRDRISLDSGAVDNPAKTGAEAENQGHQRSHAQANANRLPPGSHQSLISHLESPGTDQSRGSKPGGWPFPRASIP